MDQFDVKKRFINGLLLGYFVFIFVLLLYCFIIGLGWIKQPFMGRLFEPALKISSSSLGVINTGNDLNKIKYEDEFQLTEIDGQKIGKKNSYNKILVTHDFADPINVKLESGSDKIVETSIFLSSFPISNQIFNFYLPFVIAWMFFAIGMIAFKDQLVFGQQAGLPIFSGAMAVIFGTFFDVISTHVLFPIWIAATPIAAIGFLHFALEQLKPFHYRTQIIGFGYILAIFVSFFTWINPYGIEFPMMFTAYIKPVLFFAIPVLFLGLLVLIFASFITRAPNEKKMRVYLSISSFLSFALIGSWFILYLFNPKN